MGDETKELRDAARALEQRGDVDGAVNAYLRARDVEEAVRVLMAARRFPDAGKLLLGSLRVTQPAQAAALAGEARKAALRAAICFASAGDVPRAVELFVALGERQRAADVLTRAGDHAAAARVLAGQPVEAAPTLEPRATAPPAASSLEGARKLEAAGKYEAALDAYLHLRMLDHAARMARLLKRPLQAAALYQDGGMPYEAAACYFEGGDSGRCLENLVRVPRDHASYRKACVMAIRLAAKLNHLSFDLENFLSRFVASGPTGGERELEAYEELAELYRRHDFAENAKDAYRKLLAVRPDHGEAAARLAALEEETRGSELVYQRILRDDQSFRRAAAPGRGTGSSPVHADAPLPDLPDLPPLPSTPARAVSGLHVPAERAAARSGSIVREAGHAEAPPAPSGGPTAPEAAFVPGALIASRYRLEKRIGQGGMASVYRATDLELGEEIAIKIFQYAAEDDQMLARFKQEVMLSRKLAHPNVIRVHDIGTHKGCKYITMELLTGTDLRTRLGGAPLALVRGLEYLLQACAGLEVAHERGIVHRDVKPENFFVTTEEVLKVMDFGIAKRSTNRLTQAGMMAGTPEYMSPEQINDFSSVTSATDLYALGVTAFEMFTGRVPFTHEELMPLLMMHLREPPPAPRAVNPAIPEELEAVILKLLEKDPARRFASCRELALHLRALVSRVTAAGW